MELAVMLVVLSQVARWNADGTVLRSPMPVELSVISIGLGIGVALALAAVMLFERWKRSR